MNKITRRFGNQQRVKSFAILILLFFLSSFFTVSHAEVFTIVPNEPLPATVPMGATVNASYLVINNTGVQRDGNIVQYLPPNVIVSNEGCGPSFNLAPLGLAGDRCILNLTVFGAVDAADPNPYNHLFVCFPGSITCAGTLFPLNVALAGPKLLSISITPVFASITTGKTQQYTAIGTFSDGSTLDITTAVSWISAAPSVAPISVTGLATGINVGITEIVATLDGVTSNTAVLTVTAFAWITNFNTNQVLVCQVNADGTLSNCQDTGGTGFSQPAMIVLNQANTIAYIANLNGGIAGGISACPIMPNGTFGTCQISILTIPTFGVTLNPAGTFAYVGGYTSNQVDYCQVNSSDGLLSNCQNTNGTGFSNPIGVTINQTNTLAYVANNGSTNVTVCQISQSGPTIGQFQNCANSGNNMSQPDYVTFNQAGDVAWVSNESSSLVVFCAVNPSDGSLSNCQNTGGSFNNPIGTVLNVANTLLYVANFLGNSISACMFNPNGSFTSCSNAFSGAILNGPFGIAISN